MKILAVNIILFLMVITQPASAIISDRTSFSESEISMQFEDWMFEEFIPKKESVFTLEGWMYVELNPKQEAEFGMEDWMFESILPETEEAEFGLENWMFI